MNRTYSNRPMVEVLERNSLEFDTIFDSKFDPAFESILDMVEASIGRLMLRIGFISGENLRCRVARRDIPSIPKVIPLSQCPSGLATANRVPIVCDDIQKNENFVAMPAVAASGIRFYASQSITGEGGQVIGVLTAFSYLDRDFTNNERIQFESLAKVASHLVQSILELSLGENYSPLDFTSLFKLSPVPTAVMTYPELGYLAANEPMTKELEYFFSQAICKDDIDSRTWVAEFRTRLEKNGTVTNLEVALENEANEKRHFLISGRLLQNGKSRNVLLTAQDVTEERMKDRRFRLLLEITNIEIGVKWFKNAAAAFAELNGFEYVAISECVDQTKRQIAFHAVWKNGVYDDNFVCDLTHENFAPIFNGKPITMNCDEAGAPTELLVEGKPYLRCLPIVGDSGDTIGVISLANSNPILMSDDVEVTTKIFASRAAAKITRLNFDRSREAEIKRITMLQRISQSISKCADPDQVLNNAAEEIGKVFGVGRCVIHRRSQNGGFPIAGEYVSAPYESMLNTEVPRLGNAHAQDVMSSDRVIAVSDVFEDERFAGTEGILQKFDIRSMLAARASFENKPNGAIGLHHCGDTPRHWTPEEMNLLAAAVANIGVAIAQADLIKREKLQRQIIEGALKKAEAASKAKGDFLARMSHELRTPMNSILGFSQLLSADENLTDGHRETLKIVNRSGEHLMSLINDVLEISKIESGKQDINHSIFSPKKLVVGLSQLFAIRADSKRLRLETDLPDNLPEKIEGDENKLRQIITNLVGNAIKFTSHGDVKLKCWYFKKDKIDPQTGVLAFSVTDSGCGMTEKERQSLFTPFVQSRAGIASREGTGLGLAISKSFVELLGGEIKVESSPDQGSKFSFWVTCREVSEESEISTKALVHGLPADTSLPKGSEIKTASSQPAFIEGKNHPKPTVLIADDQPENRLLVVQFLNSIGYTVIEAVDGQDAIDACRKNKPDAILMDVRMPGTDGLAATRTIRKMKELKKQPFIVALTGNAFEEDRKAAIQAGCDKFVAKPFRLDHLLKTLTTKLGTPAPQSSPNQQK